MWGRHTQTECPKRQNPIAKNEKRQSWLAKAGAEFITHVSLLVPESVARRAKPFIS